MEKTLSLGVEEACTHKYDEARSDRKGYVFFCFHHQAAGSSDVTVGGMPWYNFSSASTLLSMDNVVLSVDFIFNLSSAAKSSSNGDIMALLQGGGYRESTVVLLITIRVKKKS